MPYYIHTLRRMFSVNVQTRSADGRCVLAVAEPYTAGSLWAAWEVLCGRAFAIKWPEPGELEEVLEQGR